MDDVTERARALYDKYRFGDIRLGAEKVRSQHEDRHLLKFLTMIPAGAHLYDIGCGTGYWMDVYHEYGIPKEKITALDLAAGNVDALRERGYSVFCGNAMDLPFADNVADCTICQGVIHHTEAPERAFGELVRITRPGGLMYISVYNQWHPYFYVVHKATHPFRYVYWNWNKTLPTVALYPFFSAAIQSITYLTKGSFMDRKSCMTLFMDQVMTPRAHLFSQARIRKYAERQGCEILEFGYTRWFDMLSAIIRVGKA